MAEKITNVKYRHRVVIEWETFGSTGYRGDIDYLLEEADKDRRKFKVSLQKAEGVAVAPRFDEAIVRESSSTIAIDLENQRG